MTFESHLLDDQTIVTVVVVRVACVRGDRRHLAGFEVCKDLRIESHLLDDQIRVVVAVINRVRQPRRQFGGRRQ